MNCPVCKTTELASNHLDINLPAHGCPSCGWNWLGARDYQHWLDTHGPTLPEKPYDGPELEVSESPDPRACPECHRTMIRYRAGHGMGFGIDQCNNCIGLWFDHNEWEALKGRNLHDEIFGLFTASAQTRARREETRAKFDEIYTKRFGEDYEEMKRVREWLDGHPRRDQILAFFNDRDPYSAS